MTHSKYLDSPTRPAPIMDRSVRDGKVYVDTTNRQRCIILWGAGWTLDASSVMRVQYVGRFGGTRFVRKADLVPSLDRGA